MHELPLGDPRWESLDGDRKPTGFDCVSLIRHLQQHGTDDAFWKTAWEELHHQGDVGHSTYAFMPYLAIHVEGSPAVDHMIYIFASVVELARESDRNPPIPVFLQPAYQWAMTTLLVAPLQKPNLVWSATLVQYHAALLAASKCHPVLGTAYQELDTDHARKFLADFFGDPSRLERGLE